MKQMLLIFLPLMLAFAASGQQVVSGSYEGGLELAFDPATRMLTGHYADYTGWDEEAKAARFSCVFYLEGKCAGRECSIKTYYPADKNDDLIEGKVTIVSSKEVKIRLSSEHGGCWNVQHFTDEPVSFSLEKTMFWIQIRFVGSAKTYFYGAPQEAKRLKAYLVKGDVVHVEKIEGGWAYCSFTDKKTTKGWIKLADLNGL